MVWRSLWCSSRVWLPSTQTAIQWSRIDHRYYRLSTCRLHCTRSPWAPRFMGSWLFAAIGSLLPYEITGILYQVDCDICLHGQCLRMHECHSTIKKKASWKQRMAQCYFEPGCKRLLTWPSWQLDVMIRWFCRVVVVNSFSKLLVHCSALTLTRHLYMKLFYGCVCECVSECRWS